MVAVFTKKRSEHSFVVSVFQPARACAPLLPPQSRADAKIERAAPV